MIETNELRLSIEELSRLSGRSVRTIRFYVAEELLEGPGTRGTAARYGDDSLLRLRIIRRLVAKHVSLPEIKERLTHLSPNQMRDILAAEDEREATEAGESEAAADCEQVSQWLRCDSRSAAIIPGARQPRVEAWQRWELIPGIELNVRADADEAMMAIVEQLLRVGRQYPT